MLVLNIIEASFEDANKEYAAKQKLDIPILTIGGEAGFGNLTTTSFQKFANNVTGITLPNTGHFHSLRKTKFCYKTDTRIFQITLFCCRFCLYCMDALYAWNDSPKRHGLIFNW